MPTTNVSSTVAALESLSDPALWSGSQSSVTVDVAPTMTLLRQPSPPPIAASVQTVHAVHDVHDHSQTQLSSDLVADPRPGAAQDFNGDLSKGPKHLHIVGACNFVHSAWLWLVWLMFVLAMCSEQSIRFQSVNLVSAAYVFLIVYFVLFGVFRLIMICRCLCPSPQK